MGRDDFEEMQIQEQLADLLSEGALDEGTPAYGIARKIIADGTKGLSVKQTKVLERVIFPALEDLEQNRELARLIESDRS